MRVESVDFFYVSMPVITLEGDGSQDALLVRVRAGGYEGWGECEASPLTSIAAFVTPPSHGACQPVSAAVLGERIDSPEDISAISTRVKRMSMDLLQAPHTFSGIEIALWDLLGIARGEPVWRLLGFDRPHAKTAYASALFGADPQETFRKGRAFAERGFRAVKFGWGPFGAGTTADDVEQLAAAREAIGWGSRLFVDAGQIWADDPAAALSRVAALEKMNAEWIEEPFGPLQFAESARLAGALSTVGVAAGEASHSEEMAYLLMEHAAVSFVQIDAGRIGGIGPSARVAQRALSRGVTYVNHTFTSHLALAASLAPYAGIAQFDLSEFPAEPKSVAHDITADHLPLVDGRVTLGDAPGLGIRVDLDAIGRYERVVEIVIDGQPVYTSASVEVAA
ncbi:mandelate racemase/muconate lactonizing enzyme family protein [Microbacterium allomyrinae]|uniref:Mandelate racemase/muconate lactonizing enzyme family protein n=1 Tax=Microbacterium allomyrinae TaxID=2830666 RepID=A0A9X1LTL8_9MICO|nr:mandelate racemase/muconate lactonizing enzyme family protein [Microbacterium allomyrinae]MCC2031577.1 mandelate racemase/muconate lactonizing enzyme family protein [Microbacterium allomyrinae]